MRIVSAALASLFLAAAFVSPAFARGHGGAHHAYHGPKTVHVHSYVTKRGTYVHSYNRARPHHHA